MHKRTLILGGGMAGLTAAMRAAELGHDVTVVQRGHRLGGKGASHRTAQGRIEEHGLHVWPGYYDNAFRVLRQIHDAADGDIPGLFPAPAVGVAGMDGAPWLANFGTNDRRPGIDAGQLSVADFVRQCGQLLTDLVQSASTTHEPSVARPQVYLSGRATPRSQQPPTTSPLRLINQLVTTLISTSVTYLPRLLQTVPAKSPSMTLMIDELVRATADLRRRHNADSALDQAIDLILTCLLGIYRDGLLTHPLGFAAANELDFCDWLAQHGAEPSTIDSGIVRGMYDLTFGYRRGDHTQPAFEAGTGLMLAGRFFFDFKGALFWKMTAGMGDVVFAPLYRHLKQLGVSFLFFHRLRTLNLDKTSALITSIELGRQADLADGIDEYQPLIETHDTYVFPEFPRAEQLARAADTRDFESHFADTDDETTVMLHHGQDFDQVILATSLGMIPHVCSQIVEADERWQAMIDNVAVVSTQALQVWATPTEAELGWVYPGSTVAGYDTRFDTYASMSHLIDVEAPSDPTGSIAYFCSVFPDEAAALGPVSALATTKQNAADFLNQQVGVFWPNAVNETGFDWHALVGKSNGSDAALDDQYYRANTDPSDRYVQSLPGSGKFRLRADDSGVTNLFLAGDWIDSGLNAGCIEAATIAGLQAANAAASVPLCEGVGGGWHPIYDQRETTSACESAADERGGSAQ